MSLTVSFESLWIKIMSGFDVIIKPYFDMLSIQGEEKTAVGMILEKI